MTNRSSENTEAFVGQRILRTEDQTLLRGRGRFVDDMPTYRNTLHAAFVRSPHPHARIAVSYTHLTLPTILLV